MRCVLAVTVLSLLFGGLSALGAQGPVQELPKIPGVPETLLATPTSLYAQIGDRFIPRYCKAYLFNLQDSGAGWIPMGIRGLWDLQKNAAGRIHVMRLEGDNLVWSKLDGNFEEEISRIPKLQVELWYVDAMDRVWVATAKNLIILQKGKLPVLFESPASRYSKSRPSKPLEYRPGYVVFFFNTCMMWATPYKIEKKKSPEFAKEGAVDGPVLLGKRCLLASGAGRREAHFIRLGAPDSPALEAKYGLANFSFLGTAPNGKALVVSWRSKEPKNRLFWLCASGPVNWEVDDSQILDKAGLPDSAIFDSKSRAYLVLQDGSIAVLGLTKMTLLTARNGLPFKVKHISRLGKQDRMVLAALDGRAVVWDMNAQLQTLSDKAFTDKGQWSMLSPCCVDAMGRMWTCLWDFPLKLCRFDGKWKPVDKSLNPLMPSILTADDKGNVQMAFRLKKGSGLVRSDGTFVHYPKDPRRAWVESVRLGATRFSIGSNVKSPIQTDGKGNIWFDDGKVLWSKGMVINYAESPKFRFWWADTDGCCYRGGRRGFWLYKQGRWQKWGEPKKSIFLGRFGLGTWKTDAPLPESLLGVQSSTNSLQAGTGPSKSKTSYALTRIALKLNGSETYIPVKAGGGWVGVYRYFQGVYVRFPAYYKIFETDYGRFFVEDQHRVLKLHRPKTLTFVGKIVELKRELVVDLKVMAGDTLAEECRLIQMVDGKPLPEFLALGRITFSRAKDGGKTFQLWALDRYGDTSGEAFWICVPRPKVEVNLPRGEVAGPQWRILPEEVKVLGQKKTVTMGGSVAIDAKGNVFASARKPGEKKGVIIVRDAWTRKWKLAFSNDPRRLFSSPDGRIWAFTGHVLSGGAGELPLYSLTTKEVKEATRLYHDRPQQDPLLAWGADSALWNVSLRWVGRWDGKKWQGWERNVGAKDASLVPFPGGRMAIVSRTGICTWTPGKGLSETFSLPSDWRPDGAAYPLGADTLVLKIRRPKKKDQKYSGWATYDLRSRTLGNLDKYHHVCEFEPDGDGNLFVWEPDKRFRILSGKDGSEKPLPYFEKPHFDGKGFFRNYRFLRKSRTLVFSSNDSLITWDRKKGAKLHGWKKGILPGYTVALAEDPEGRLWMRREHQILVFDPRGDPDLDPHPFDGWDIFSAAKRPIAGFQGDLWYLDEDKRTVVWTNGLQKKTWTPKPEETDDRDGPELFFVSDQGDAIAKGDYPSVLRLRPDGAIEVLKNEKEAILTLVSEGARVFHCQWKTAVAGRDGKVVYYDRKVWNGKTWQHAKEGRSFQGPNGRLMVIHSVQGSRSLPFKVYEYDETGKESKVKTPPLWMIDDLGVRLFDKQLMRKRPGRYLVLHGKQISIKGKMHWRLYVSLKPDDNYKKQWPVSYVRRTVPDGKGSLILQTDKGLYIVGEKGFRTAIREKLPFGLSTSVRAIQLKNGRFAWAWGTQVFLSPKGFDIPLVPDLMDWR